nr:MAG TPA: hypothetical protein [Caudoviricetes sp.]
MRQPLHIKFDTFSLTVTIVKLNDLHRSGKERTGS